MRAVAARDHHGPAGVRVRIARSTLDRWIRQWRIGGFDALVPASRTAEPVTPAAILDLAVKSRRTAAQVTAIIAAVDGWAPSERTVQRLFARHGLNTRPDGTPSVAFGRFEAALPNDRWTGDALHGPVVGGHKAYLFPFIDDHSRAIPGYRWGHSEDTVRLEATLRVGVPRRWARQRLREVDGQELHALGSARPRTPCRDRPSAWGSSSTVRRWRRTPPTGFASPLEPVF